MRTCEEVINNISLYIDNELNDKEVEEFEKHISQCDNCTKELEDIKEVVLRVNNLEEIELPEGFHEELVLKLNKESIKWYNTKNFKKYTLAASLFFIFISVTLFTNTLTSNELEPEGFSATSYIMGNPEVNMSRSHHNSNRTYNILLTVDNLEEAQTAIDNLLGDTLLLGMNDTDFKWATFQKDISINEYEFIEKELTALGSAIIEKERINNNNNEEIISLIITIEEINNIN